MQVERQRYEETYTQNPAGTMVKTGERPIGKPEKFEFGVPGDAISKVIGGGFTSSWNPGFFQKELGRNVTVSRFYFDRKMAVDVADPEQGIVKRKRKLLFKHGFGYLCIPEHFPQDENKLRNLYKAALDEYYGYEKLHPRPAVIQETMIIDEKGNPKRALMTAIDTRVGGGFTGNVEQQAAELTRASKLSKKELEQLKNYSRLHRRLRQSLQTGKPFRNPYVSEGKRLFLVQYAQ